MATGKAKTRIRKYRHGDRKACRELWGELTGRHREIYSDPAIGGDDPAAGFDSYIENPKLHAVWVAEVEERVVGMTGLLLHGEEAEVEPVVVSSRYRSRGIGGRLLVTAVRRAKKAGVHFLSVRPVARNVEAISFFVEAGFDIVGQIDLFQDLLPARKRKWKDGIVIHGRKLRY